MKKYFYFLSFLLLLTSCADEIRFNNPAFQTLKDNTFWRAQIYKAGAEANGVFIIEGSLGYEKISFQIPSPAQKTYILGVDDITKASCESTFSGQETVFTTGAGKGSGQIIVTEYNTAEKTISGTFRFTAVNVDPAAEKQEMHFTEGVFHKIPVSSESNFTTD